MQLWWKMGLHADAAPQHSSERSDGAWGARRDICAAMLKQAMKGTGRVDPFFPSPLNTKRAGFVVYIYTPVCRERRKRLFSGARYCSVLGSLNLISWRLKQDEVGTNLGPT